MLEQLGAFLARPFNSSNAIKINFLTRLPEDILLPIIKQLSVRDLSMLYRSCDYFKKLSKHAELPIIRISNAAFNAMCQFPTTCGIDDDIYISVYYGIVTNDEVKFSEKNMLDFHVRVRQTLDQIEPSLTQKFTMQALDTRFYKAKSIVATEYAPTLDLKVKASLMASIEYLNASYNKSN